MKSSSRSLSIFALLLATSVAISQTNPGKGPLKTDRVQSSQQSAEPKPEVPSGYSTSSTATRALIAHPGSHEAEGYPQSSSAESAYTISVDVSSAAIPEDVKPKEASPAALSPGFAAAALNAANTLKFTERRIANSIKMGFPLGEFWIQTDFDSIDESLRLAALSATNEADRRALQQLESQTQRLRLWSDWLINQNREMRLADYYISPSPLKNDERFQNTVTCTNFLLSMLASGRLAEDSSCM